MRDQFRRFLMVSLLLVLAPVALLSTATSPASASGQEPGEVEQPQPDDSEPDETLNLWPGQSCTFYARADDPHRSGNDASGHGAWVNTSSPSSNCPSRAWVTVKLQVWWCWGVNPYECEWRTMETRTQTKYSKQRVAVHIPCRTYDRASWRTHVTVRVPISGWFDKSDSDSNTNVIKCHA